MKIIDRIYGEEEITEPILIELIESPALQRLKNISQLGMPQEYNYKKVFSRYEHSVGVLILLRRLKFYCLMSLYQKLRLSLTLVLL
ncbi:MAG: hypothetical protein IIA88_02745 [Bacteroidetes bacterium]|nr:hypothetical protein [Bacteroidota bacterium]